MLISKQRLAARPSDLLYALKRQPVDSLKQYISHPHWRWYSSARWALEDLLLQLKAKNSAKQEKIFTVALPAFTCKVVSDAAKRAKSKICYYDTGIISSIPQIIRWIEAQTTAPNALVVSYNLGFVPKEIKELSNFCKKQGIILIEDCAQALGAISDSKAVGSFGDYAIYSFGISKNLAATGAILATNKEFTASTAQAMPVLETIKILFMLATHKILLHPFLFGFTNKFLNEQEHKGYPAKKYSLPQYFQNMILYQARRYEKTLKLRRENLNTLTKEYNGAFEVLEDPENTKGSALYFTILSSSRDKLSKLAKHHGLDIYQMYSFENLAGSAKQFPLAHQAEKQHLCFATLRSKTELRKVHKILKTLQ